MGADALKEFFVNHPKVALGFSGGVDSSYLLYAGKLYGADIRPYFVKSAFQPAFELNDARRIGELLKIPVTVVELDVLSDPVVAANPSNRCYYCKKRIFSALSEHAVADGYTVLIDGTNASDDAEDRPGMKAITELSVLSPLRLCGMDKDSIRALSKQAGLFTWDKPSYACLATRVPTGRAITADLLKRIETAEDALFALGFEDFRVRVMGETARLQLLAYQMDKAIAERDALLAAILPVFDGLVLDMKGR